MGMHFQKVICVGAIVIGCFSTLLIIVCKLLGENISNVLLLEDKEFEFDYVIVGAGTAGSTLTSLLTKHSNGSVLLIEAGGSFGFLSRIPLLTTFQQKGTNDWSFLSVPQKHSSKGLIEQRQCLPRGKGLGGSANLNYMLHFDGHGPDFDAWHKLHNLSNWSWTDIRPFLAAAKPKPGDLFEVPRSYSTLTQALDESEAEFSHKPWHFRRSVYNIKNGLRHSVLQQFLLPVLNSVNLRLLPQALVKGIKLSSTSNPKASSVVVGVKDEHSKELEFHIKVRRELLLCAGAYQTPQLLLASGIGDSTKLTQLGLQVQHHLPLVGQGLHDHFNVPLFVSIDTIGPTLNQRMLLSPMNLFKYLSTGSGAFGNFGVLGHVAGYEEQTPFGITFFGAGAIDESAFMSISNFKRSAFRALFPRYHNASQEGFIFISSCLQPKSRGFVSLQHKSMRRNPLIDPNYLSNKQDVACTIAAIRNAVKVVTSSAFAELRPRIHWPKLQECANFGPFERDFVKQQPSDNYLECLMRHIGLGSHHPGGSCALGSVVDSQLKLYGLANVRVVDASVLPRPISGNPNTVITAIAMRAATWILKNELQDS
ncbi:neither inactivation nor afterpotential protein G [Drosophila novamexicana]|uniref:neither inactivation nor afterpotential protein G n=1 Tax=Drosophila novamexicana TaxID=47314 RepID=UPI0011E5F66E|nr:neither inactivation nor afterpotential protein G [Drosophila novamexicana]